MIESLAFGTFVQPSGIPSRLELREMSMVDKPNMVLYAPEASGSVKIASLSESSNSFEQLRDVTFSHEQVVRPKKPSRKNKRGRAHAAIGPRIR